MKMKKKKAQQILATAIMGMNAANTMITPMALTI